MEASDSHFATDLVYRGVWVQRQAQEASLRNYREAYERDAYRLRCRWNPRAPWNTVVDIGANIGAFTLLAHQLEPAARIVAVEVCPANIPALERNIGTFAWVVEAACTYEDPAELVLYSTGFPGTNNTGGSIVSPPAEHEDPAYVRMPIGPVVTLDDLCDQFRLERIGLLKLDCEGSEFSILGKARCLDRIDAIVGEYHDRARFEQLVGRLEAAGLRLLALDGACNMGTFYLARTGR